MTRKTRIILLAAIGGVLALSIVAFTVLFFAVKRGGDKNNEDAVRAIAEAALAEDNPPYAEVMYRRLLRLNPFKEEYRQKYIHSLVRMRDYNRLAAFTNETACVFELTADERKIEEAISRGVAWSAKGSNELAVAAFESATNLNFFAVTPFLIDCHARQQRLDRALTVSRIYLKTFCDPRLLIRSAEWAALARRPDLIDEMRDLAVGLTPRVQVLAGYYCDALQAWLENKGPEMVTAFSAVERDIHTPLANLMALEVACMSDDPWRVENCFKKVLETNSLFDFKPQAQVAVRQFIAAHFPQKLPIARLGRLADLIQDEKNPDVDLLRVSLLAKASSGLLSSEDVKRAVKLFPMDRGIARIRETYERSRQ